MSKLPRGIYEKIPGSKTFWIRYADSSGRIRREKAGQLGAALKLYRKRKTEVLQGKKLPETMRGREIRFEEIAEDALEYSKTHKASYRSDKVRMKRLKDAFGPRPADSITPQDVERFFVQELEGRKPATVNRYKALISLTFRLGIQNRKVTTNPARLIRQRRENNAKIRFLSAEEETQLRAAILEKCPHHLPELELALNTGLRLSEQYSLTWDYVDFERRSATVRVSKNGETRHVPLNDPALAALLTARQYSNGEDAVFCNRSGEPLQTPRKWFEAAIKDAEIKDFTWHCLRHTFASRAVMAGVDLTTVKELLGHKTILMTLRYAHLAPKHMLAAVQLLCSAGEAGATQSEATDTRTSTNAIAQSDAREAVAN
jgi:site-specific recombinase XerD